MFSHFSLSKKAVKVLVFVWCLAAAVAFVGCDDGSKSKLLEGLPGGSWLSSFDEEFTITASTFTSGFGGAVTYKGDIVNFRQDGSGAGYITIKYTSAYNPASVGKYYVIHWRSRTESSVELSGASDGDGKATKAEAEAEYTVAKGYFAFYSACTKQ
jgi:hypothetical protein